MCGIWGYVGDEAGTTVESAWKGLCSLTDRGPDDWGLYVHDEGKFTEESALPEGAFSAVLGNRRLSILDVSAAGNQPMVSDGRWIVYNGEVYNYREIRETLATKGYDFVSDTDTEVVLKAYQEFGADCVQRFRGMFAFAVYDTTEEEVFVARDRFGIKPFYYAEDGGNLAFASEVTALLDGDAVGRTLDPIGVDGFLAFGYVPSPRTIIDGVQSLPPGSTLTYRREDSTVEIDQYYRANSPRNQTSSANRLRELLHESVRLRMRSDVPVGAFLSGGLDSSAVVAAMCDVAPEDADIRTYSIDFDEEEYSEGAFAEEVAEKLDTRHQSQSISPEDLRDELDSIIDAMDQPTVDGVNTYFVSKLAAGDGTKVALSGLGSDELLCGYPTFREVRRRHQRFQRISDLPDSVRLVATTMLERVGRFLPKIPSERGADFLRSDSSLGAAYLASRGRFTRTQRERILSDAKTIDWTREIQQSVSRLESGGIETISELELYWYMHNQLLRDTDSMSMSHSLEVRVPFLDVELADFVLSVPKSTKVGQEKQLLKDAVENLVPTSVIDREKRGFVFPLGEWLRGELSETLDEVFQNDELLLRAGLNPESARSIRDDFIAGDSYWADPWALFVLSKWVDRHLSPPHSG